MVRRTTCRDVQGRVGFHLTRELQRVNDFNAVVDYTEMFASFAGEFVDLRSVNPRPDCLHPDPAVGYPVGNSLAELIGTAVTTELSIRRCDTRKGPVWSLSGPQPSNQSHKVECCERHGPEILPRMGRTR